MIVRDQTVPTVVEWLSPEINEIEVLFNESMDPLTIDVENLTLIDSTGTAITVAFVDYDDPLNPKRVTFSTDILIDSLTLDETYTATLQVTDDYPIEDGRGNALADIYTWTFKKK